MTNIDLAIVGSGIDALMTALYASRKGCSVRVIAKGADPRGLVDAGEYFASTYNGQETRYVTPYEGHPYFGDSPMYPDMASAFAKSYDQGGWLGKSLEKYNEREQGWLKKRAQINKSESFKNDAFDWYVDANLTAMGEWRSLRDELPQLFEGTQIEDGVVRAYDSSELYEFAKELHEKDGVLLSAVAGDDLPDAYPYFEDAYRNGSISGALKIEGFSIDAQRFCRNMIDYLEELGVNFSFGSEVTNLDRNNEGEVTGLITCDERFEAKNYSLHMGAYNVQNVLKNTTAEDSIAGMEGRWVRMVAPEGMKNSMKIHGDKSANRPVIDQNHALLNDGEAVVGFGYLFSGFDPNSVDPDLRLKCDEDNKALVEKLFPNHVAKNPFENIARGCVRSWTYNDLPRADAIKTAQGGSLLVCGGGNTGSFTQSTTQATNNLSSLREEPNASIEQLLELHKQSDSLAK